MLLSDSRWMEKPAASWRRLSPHRVVDKHRISTVLQPNDILSDGASQEIALNRRMTDRRDVVIRAILRVRGTVKLPITVEDLSQTGFRCECIYDIPLGGICWLALPKLTGLQAEVVRRDGWMYGFMFSSSLYPAILDHIAQQYHR